MGLGGGLWGGQCCYGAEDGGPPPPARSVWRGPAKSTALEKELEGVPMSSPPRAAQQEKGEKRRKTVISVKITFVWGLGTGEKVWRWEMRV